MENPKEMCQPFFGSCLWHSDKRALHTNEVPILSSSRAAAENSGRSPEDGMEMEEAWGSKEEVGGMWEPQGTPIHSVHQKITRGKI